MSVCAGRMLRAGSTREDSIPHQLSARRINDRVPRSTRGAPDLVTGRVGLLCELDLGRELFHLAGDFAHCALEGLVAIQELSDRD